MTVFMRNSSTLLTLAAAALALGIPTAVRADESAGKQNTQTQQVPPAAGVIDPARAAEKAHAALGAARAMAASETPADAPRGDTPTNMPDAAFTVVEVDGTTKSGPTGAHFDFGTVSPLDTDHFAHTFVLRNDSASPIVIDKIPPTCGCTTVVVEGQDQAFPMTVAPGKDIHIRTSVAADHLSGGTFTKNVLVYLQGKSVPTHTLELTGSMRSAIEVDPLNVDFGRIKHGEVPAQPITVLIDRKLLKNGWTPKVTSSIAGMTVTEISEKQAKALRAKMPTAPGTANVTPAAMVPASESDKNYAARYYKLSLTKSVKIGYFWGQLIIPKDASATAATASMKGMSQPNYGNIHGEVYGDISASPFSVSFGTVTPGQADAHVTVVLNGTSQAILENLKIESASPLLHYTLDPIDPATPTARNLQLTLDPKVGPGSFQSEVTVKSTKGDEIAVTAMAYVMTPPSTEPAVPATQDASGVK
jgi:hypothetical protein